MAIGNGIAKTMCNMCSSRCGIDVHVENGRIVGVQPMAEHPFRHICVKAHALPEFVYHKDRVTQPMRKVSGKWRTVSWDDALDFISDKLVKLKERHGARSLAVHLGFPFIGTPAALLAQRFCDAYESPNFTTGSSICYWARGLAQSITFNHETVPMTPNLQGSRCVMVWGINPTESNLAQLAGINQCRKDGARLIVIDPRAIPLARQADIHAQLRPGTDTALALAMLNVIISEQLYDKEFVARWTFGFDQLAEHVKQYPPEKVAEITWIPADTIRNMARMYATTHPACITQGVALDHSVNGVQASRAICCLVAICGNFDILGGSSSSPRLQTQSLRLAEGISGEIGASYPIFTRLLGQSTSATMVNAILTGRPYRIKALIVNGCNFMLTWPETQKIQRAVEKLELFVVMDMFLNETASLADVVLPAASFVESSFFRDYAPSRASLVVLGQQVIEPPGDCQPDWQFWVALGRKMGYSQNFPWNTDEELYRTLLKPSGITLEQLKEKPGGIVHHPREERRYLRGGFHTPSGKAELYSELMAKHGYEPLPTYHEPAESPVSRPGLAEEYPLILTSGPRVGVYTHSQFRNLESLLKRHPEPLVQVHPDTAGKLGITDGEMAKVETKRGSVEMKTQVTPDIHPRVISIPHGWGGKANTNMLTSNDELDPVSGFPAFKAMLCRVSKA